MTQNGNANLDRNPSESRHRQLESLFGAAAELPSSGRVSYLDAHCPPELRAEVDELLALDNADRPELSGTQPGVRRLDAVATHGDTLGQAAHPSRSRRSDPPVPDRIGAYQIGPLLGEGGMGQVYQAEQSEPVRRTVALKIIRSGLDNREILARFEAEKQTLARMSHPSIAKVLDAGTTDHGLPYFVMELVDGVPIQQFCETNRLSPRARVELFIKVLKAVEHAHQKGVIHRDLKPSNILIATTDDDPHPVVIDFGIAKAMDTVPEAGEGLTHEQQFLGTPEYMSPEQASLAHRDVDTRTDIYALGIVLYELLTGSPPFEPEMLRQAGLLEILRIIREVDPPRPSTRVTTQLSHGALPSERRTELKVLGRMIRGDLDWIVMKCLEKERDRRYPSASELIDDLRRHLRFEPVLAGRPSRGYRTRRFVRKHRVAVATSTFAIIALIAGLVTSTYLYFEAVRATENALDSKTIAEDAADRERLAANVARAEAKKSRQADSFLLGAIASADPDQDGRDIRLTTILDRVRNDLTQTFEDPYLKASLYRTLAATYRALGLYQDAEELLRLPLEDDHLPPGEKLELELEHAQILLDLDRKDEAGILLSTIETRIAENTNKPSVEARPTITGRAAVVRSRWHRLRGEFDDAERLLPEGREAIRSRLGEVDALTRWSNEEYIELLDSMGRRKQAITLLTQLVSTYTTSLGQEHSVTLRARNDLAHQLGLSDPEAAESIFRHVLAIQRKKLGSVHPDTLQTLNNLAVTCWNQKKFGEAEALYLEAWDGFEQALGRHHPHTLNEMNNLAVLYTRVRRLDDAKAILSQALDRHEEVPTQPRLRLATRHNLAEALFVDRDYEKAARIAHEVARESLELHPDDRFRVAVYHGSYGKCLRHQHEYEKAEPELLLSARLLQAELGTDHAYTQEAIYQLTRLYNIWGKPEVLRTLEQKIQSVDIEAINHPPTPRH